MDTSKIQEVHPIGTLLDVAHESLSVLEQKHGNLESVDTSELQIITIQFVSALLTHEATSILPSKSGSKKLRVDLMRFINAITSDFDFGRVKPLLATVLRRKSDQEFWDQVYKVVTESTPTPQLTSAPSLVKQTPRTRSTGHINSSQQRESTDMLLKQELDVLYVDVPDFHKAFLGHIPGLEAATDAVFKDFQARASPQYCDGKWVEWPNDANQYKVLSWLRTLCNTLANVAKDYGLNITRQFISFPDKYPTSATPARRKLDVGFIDKLRAESEPSFSDMHILGELKCNPNADTAVQAWFDNARYVREVFALQDDRRFVLAFTLCGPRMRVWKFDRLGGIGSDQFDINEDGRRLVLTLLGFLTIGQADLGYDPTIRKADDGKRFIEISRNGKQERLIIQYPPILRIPCIVGRATTCWKAYSEDHPEKTLVIKDSWQDVRRDVEGDLLQLASMKGVTNVATYYHHETVQVDGRDDDILNNVRKNLDMLHTRQVRLFGTSSRKRGSSPTNAGPPSKRSSSQRPATPSVSLSKAEAEDKAKDKAKDKPPSNRVHRRVIVCDYGIPIYQASSRVNLLTALGGCIRGHRSLLLDAHLLHRDISLENLMIKEHDINNSFLIDLDLAVDPWRTDSSGSEGITGTQAFMSIGALRGKQHTFRDDLESFLWVLFWICIHYNNTGDSIVKATFESWNYQSPMDLAVTKRGYSHHEEFMSAITDNFTPSYQCLIPYVEQLRKAIFQEPVTQDMKLYDDVLDILRKAREDSEVAAPWQ
ncbi:hypothetical protein VM1G_00594 [Cytospora mali]|uniref:non-specific serine/threonine protein kinase n=1 Tax=Cytospora mali TaxID=578113 RepID=A0A194VMY7_CYTMA|nr:hypothetical protein VM1G_00594 [Valsa mali]